MNRHSKQLSRNKNGISRWLLVIPVIGLIIWGISLIIQDQDDSLENLEYVNGHLLNRKLLSIADNQWVKIYPQATSLLQRLSFDT